MHKDSPPDKQLEGFELDPSSTFDEKEQYEIRKAAKQRYDQTLIQTLFYEEAQYQNSYFEQKQQILP